MSGPALFVQLELCPVTWFMSNDTTYRERERTDGFEAGWRRDEVVTEKSLPYKQGYEAGQLARQQYEERSALEKEQAGG